jgi:hypothetical protein
MISRQSTISVRALSILALCGLSAMTSTSMATTVSSRPLEASDVGAITLGGNGCSNADLRAPYSAATGLVSLRFQDYSPEAAAGTSRRLARKTCQIAIPLRVSEGERIVVRDLSLRGQADLQPETNATVSLEAFIAGETGERLENTITTKSAPARRYIGLRERDVIFAGTCGQSGTLRFNTSAMIANTESEKTSYVRVGTLRFKLMVAKCSAEDLKEAATGSTL